MRIPIPTVSVLLCAMACSGTLNPTRPAAPRGNTGIIPRPTEVTVGSGFFQLDSTTRILIPAQATPELERLARHAAEAVSLWTSREPHIERGSAENNAINLRLVSGDGAEGAYNLEVNSRGVFIEAGSGAGIFYGIQTLKQLLNPGTEALQRSSDSGRGELVIRYVTINDNPRFAYRGMHLDVGRHLYPVAFIKRYIALISLYKMNTFHWHLTEDQGWRIEIRKYPLLTEVGAYRSETMVEQNFDPYVGDGERYGGYYTQAEIRDIVAFAAERYVTIIPEIEMPGHSTAAIAAYPELGCPRESVDVATVWGVHPHVYCPTEQTFQFLEDVLTEVISLFPGPYVHVGGDEAPKTQWESSDAVREIMERENLRDYHEVQSYFIQRIERFLNANNRKLIGWDEILEGGLAPDATVMSWRGMEGGIKAARAGHDVIMAPTSHVYFDYYQGNPETEPLAIGGFLPLSKVYEFEPVPAELSADEARFIIGAQGNVWTEYLKTAEQVEYMVFPRLLGLSEVVWSDATRRDWDDFVRRLRDNVHVLDQLGVAYRPLDVP